MDDQSLQSNQSMQPSTKANQTMQIPQEVRPFLESLLEDAQMTLDDEMKEDMLQELYVQLDNFLAANVLDVLPEDKKEPFISLNEKAADQEEINQFIRDSIPNSEEFFAQAFDEFREMYLGKIATFRSIPSVQTAPGEPPKEE